MMSRLLKVVRGFLKLYCVFWETSKKDKLDNYNYSPIETHALIHHEHD